MSDKVYEALAGLVTELEKLPEWEAGSDLRCALNVARKLCDEEMYEEGLTPTEVLKLALFLRGTEYNILMGLHRTDVEHVWKGTALEAVLATGLARCKRCNRWGWYQDEPCLRCRIAKLTVERDQLLAALTDLMDLCNDLASASDTWTSALKGEEEL